MKTLLTSSFIVLILSAAAAAQAVIQTANDDEVRIPVEVISSLPARFPAAVPVSADPTATPLPATSGPTPSGYVRPDARERARRYRDSIISPVVLGRMVLSAGFSTWDNSPSEWGNGWSGFGKHVASNFGQNLIRSTTTYGLDEALKTDSHFYPKKKGSFGKRLGNAVSSVFLTRTSSGKRTVGVPRLAGNYIAPIIAAETWCPDRYSWKDGVRSGTSSLGFSALLNILREFVFKK